MGKLSRLIQDSVEKIKLKIRHGKKKKTWPHIVSTGSKCMSSFKY